MQMQTDSMNEDALNSPQRDVPRGASMADVALWRDPAANTPSDALRALKDGNARFYSNEATRSGMSANERRAQIMQQTPFAVVLGCADSRVPTEIVFDQGPGDLFSVRVIGNVAESAALGSVEYAIANLKVHLLVVLGHEGCGAVNAALSSEAERALQPPDVRAVLEGITPAVAAMPHISDSKARMREAVVLNVRHQVARVRKNAVVREAEARGQIAVMGAFYEIGSGAVDWLDE